MRIAPFLLLASLAALPAELRAAPMASVSGSVLVMSGPNQVPGEYVYVYLEPTKKRPRSRTPRPTQEIKHKGQQFDPHVLVVPLGTYVKFPNNDTEDHNAFSPTEADSFDLGVYGRGLAKKANHTFDVPAEVDIFCDIHRDMWAKVKVVDSEWIAEVKKDGTYTIANVSAGTYKLVVWAPNSREVRSAPFTVEEGKSLALDFVPHLQLGAATKAHKRKDGSEYGPYRPQP